MEQIKDIIPQVIDELAQTKPGLQAKIKQSWRRAARGGAAHHASVAGMRKGKLVISVDSPVWLFQLNLQKKKVLEQLKKEIPELSDITFRIGKIE